MRNSKIYLATKILGLIPQYISTVVFLLIVGIAFQTALVLSMCVSILSAIHTLATWRTTIFYIEKDIFYKKSGIFQKMEMKIPLESIVAVDIKESFKQRMVGLQTLVIDRGITNDISDIEVILRKRDIAHFRSMLLIKQSVSIDEAKEEAQEALVYRVSNRDLLIYISTKNQYFGSTVLCLSAFFFLGELGVDIGDMIKGLLKNNGLMLLILISFIVVKLISIVLNSVKYHGFMFERKGDILDISHGFFSKSTCSLHLGRISAVKITQSPIQKLFRSVSISVSTIGYGDNIGEEALVFLNIEAKYVDEIMEALFSQYIFVDAMYDISPKHRLRYKKVTFGHNKALLAIRDDRLYTKYSIISMSEIETLSVVKKLSNRWKGTQNLEVRYKGIKRRDLSRIVGIGEAHIEEIKKRMT